MDNRESRETKYDNGQLKEQYHVARDPGGSYVNDGPYLSYHLTGQKWKEGSFSLGKGSGEWSEYGSRAITRSAPRAPVPRQRSTGSRHAHTRGPLRRTVGAFNKHLSASASGRVANVAGFLNRPRRSCESRHKAL